MALPFVTNFPGPRNVYIPAFGGKQTANLITSFARDPKRFLVNRLPQRTPTELLNGNWLQLRPEALARVLTDPNSVIWVDGQPAPSGTHNAQDFRAIPYYCMRRAQPDYVGWQTKEQAVYPIQETKLAKLGHLMMTYRTQAFYTVALDSANHITTAGQSHVRTATQWSDIGGTGAKWDAGTIANPVIKRSLANIADQIRRDSINTVNYKDLSLVITPPLAIAMANSEEVHGYIATSPAAVAQIRGDVENQNGEWGLPTNVYGMELLIDGTVKTVSPRMQVPGNFTDILTDTTALVLATPGAIKGNMTQVSSLFSSIHQFIYRGQEMVVKSQDFPWDELTKFLVYETYDFKVVAPETCGLVTECYTP